MLLFLGCKQEKNKKNKTTNLCYPKQNSASVERIHINNNNNKKQSGPQKRQKARQLQRVLPAIILRPSLPSITSQLHYPNSQKNICWKLLGHKTYVATLVPPSWSCNGRLWPKGSLLQAEETAPKNFQAQPPFCYYWPCLQIGVNSGCLHSQLWKYLTL